MESKVGVGEAVEFDNRKWEKELQKVACLGNCKFPARTEIEIGGRHELVTIRMKKKGLQNNMQTDAAAFEAWALTLLCHCHVQRIQIDVDPGAATRDPHYERFLYRLKRFAELFPKEVILMHDAESKALKQGKRIWNQSSSRSATPEANSAERMQAASREKHRESDLEMALEVSSAFRKHFRLDKVMRQWPVGLFDGCVGDGNKIFTGGKSGIDLIGIRGDTLVLFELKKVGNEKAGAISELFFYASVMRDSIGHNPIFEFQSMSARSNCPISPDDVVRCSKICAVLLAPRVHPLISKPGILERLNSATAGLYVEKPIHFETVTFRCPDDKCIDFIFK